jgi:hypothetical protein
MLTQAASHRDGQKSSRVNFEGRVALENGA